MGLLVGDDAAFEHEGEGVEGWFPADGPALPASPASARPRISPILSLPMRRDAGRSGLRRELTYSSAPGNASSRELSRGAGDASGFGALAGLAVVDQVVKPAFGERAYACAGAQDC
jgi:hypothetical protein